MGTLLTKRQTFKDSLKCQDDKLVEDQIISKFNIYLHFFNFNPVAIP